MLLRLTTNPLLLLRPFRPIKWTCCSKRGSSAMSISTLGPLSVSQVTRLTFPFRVSPFSCFLGHSRTLDLSRYPFIAPRLRLPPSPIYRHHKNSGPAHLNNASTNLSTSSSRTQQWVQHQPPSSTLPGTSATPPASPTATARAT